jgi:hypothetical protein
MYMCVVLVIMIAVYGLKGGREEEEAYCRVLVVADGCGQKRKGGTTHHILIGNKAPRHHNGPRT